MSTKCNHNIASLNHIAPIDRLQSCGKPIVIAGPCSAETREQTLQTANQLASHGIQVYRAGIWKPRTLPNSFEGVGSIGLDWLREVKQQTGMMVATEVATTAHLKLALQAGIDIVWIGARTSANPFAMQEIADAVQGHEELTVLVKNPISPDLDLWIGGLQRLYRAGITRLGAIHRGFSTSVGQMYRNDPQWHIPMELRRRIGKMTILCDPSHIGGRRELVPTIAQQALDIGFDGLMIESHIQPDDALSDKQQQLTPTELAKVLAHLVTREGSTMINENLQLLRQQIDDCDHELLETLCRRMNIARQIGQYKKNHNMQVFQNQRYETVMEARCEQAKQLGLSIDFIEQLMQAIHAESVRQQVQLFNENSI